MVSKFSYKALVWMMAASLVVAFQAAADTSEPNPKAMVGKKIEDFTLHNSHGEPVSLSDFEDKDAVVVIFIGTECPISNRYIPYLNEMEEEYGEDVQFIGINSLTFNTPEMIKKHAKEYQISFPVLIDEKQEVLLQFDAERTPDCFVLDKDRVVRYMGRIDDRSGYTYNRDDPKRHDLEEAIKEVVAGKEVSVKTTDVMGCVIVRDESVQEKG